MHDLDGELKGAYTMTPCIYYVPTWIASSRVGAMASARMATTVFRPPPWLPPPGPASSSLYMMGSMKARVLPEPVCATLITSMPGEGAG